MTVQYATWRNLSLLVAAAGAWHVRSHPHEVYAAVFGGGTALILIWFPQMIDDLSIGQWTRGGRIDAPTPPFLIAAVGWVLLGVVTWFLFSVG